MSSWTRWIAASLVAALATISAAKADDVKKLSPEDLAAQTHKWDGKKIEVQLRCFFADKDEYRCMGGGARVDFGALDPGGKQHLEDKCDTLSKLALRECLVTVRFVYLKNSREDVGTRQKVTYIVAENDFGEIIPPPTRKRR